MERDICVRTVNVAVCVCPCPPRPNNAPYYNADGEPEVVQIDQRVRTLQQLQLGVLLFEPGRRLAVEEMCTATPLWPGCSSTPCRLWHFAETPKELEEAWCRAHTNDCGK